MKKRTIVLIVIGAIILYISPIIFVFGVALLEDRPIPYKEVDNKVIIEKYGVTLTVDGTHLDDENNCFIIDTKVEKDNNSKKISTLDFTYEFKNKDGYVLGDASLYLDSMDKNSKWKKSISYCDEYAKEVSSFKIKEVHTY